MPEKLDLIWYENPTRPNPNIAKPGDAKHPQANSKQQVPKTVPTQKKPVKLAKD